MVATGRRAAWRWLIMSTVVAMLRTATAAMASRMARLPNQPMMKVASGGPATQATETMARVLTMSAVGHRSDAGGRRASSCRHRRVRRSRRGRWSPAAGW